MRRSVDAERIGPGLDTGLGLTSVEAAERLRRFGRNDIVESHALSWVGLLKDTAGDPMLWFLLATALLFLALGDLIEAIILFIAILPLAGMDLFLHRRTRASTEGLASRLTARTVVKRDGHEQEIAATDLVPGDLVLLRSGQNIPADGLILRCDALQVDESILTGEAFPVRKEAVALSAFTVPSVTLDSRHWAFAGTRLLAGSGEMRVTHTGGASLYGEVVRSANAGMREQTPLQLAVAKLVRLLVVGAVALCGLLFAVRWWQGFGLVDATLSALTLAVAALPEEFPVVFTFFLGVGVYRLAQRHALVRRAVAVENIGRVSCICTDKTGTITLGELRLAHVFPAAGIDEAGLLVLAGLASRSDSGDPIDTAILQAQTQGQAGGELVRTFPFAEDRRRETNIWRRSDGTLAAMTKGAPETILAMCTLGSSEREAWRAQVAALAAEAHKVIACAVVDLVPGWHDGEPDRELRFAGLLAFEDPVRESVPEAIAQCRAAGIHVVMITGDHAATATAVAREIGLGGGEPRTLEADSLAAWPQDLREIDVIARALPAQKVDVVRALQAAGEIVAVTGDGVNDVPALQIADIGLAMGERGTRSAREVSAIVLLDENFRTIIRAIVEGRQLFRNLKLSFAYLIMLHIPLVVTAALVPLAGFPLLYLPIHIVWLELILHPTALLAFQDLPAGAALVREPGRREARFFNRREWGVMLVAGGGNAVLILLGYIWILDSGATVEHARALVMALLALVSVSLLTVLSGLRSAAARWIAVLTLLPSLVMIQLPGLAEYLHVQPLHAVDWAVVGGCALLVAAVAMLGRFRNADHG